MDRRVFNSVQEPVFGVLKEVQESGLWYVKEDKKKCISENTRPGALVGCRKCENQ